ncbi:MAG: VOC family protein [Bacteroidetes bacterium]|nr:MAG: VOC family protein [Bacteroidota bacterium]
MKYTTPKVTGIGGIFFRSKNPDEINYLRWSPFEEKTDYFNPSKKEFMINYRVQNIEGMVKKLKENGVTVVAEIETYEYGKFVHIMDPEGNKIELWEPVDSIFTETGGATTK